MRAASVRRATTRAGASAIIPEVAKLLLNLRDVPDDEADEIRALLEERGIAFYETPPNRWGISAGGIWVRNEGDVPNARRLMVEYQAQRHEKARGEYRAAKREGKADTIWGSFRESPLTAIAALLGIVLIVAILALPFLLLG